MWKQLVYRESPYLPLNFAVKLKNQSLLKNLMGGAGVWTQEGRVIVRPLSVAARSQASMAPTGRKSPRTLAGGCLAGLEASRSEVVTATSGFVGPLAARSSLGFHS